MPIEDLVSKQEKIMRYIKQDEETARNLVQARGDISTIRSVLSKASTDDFIIGIVNSPQYDGWTFDVADKIINQFPEVAQEVQDKLIGIKQPKQKPKKIKVKKYKSKTKGGKVYEKTYNKWTNQEITFLKARKDKNVKDVYKEFEDFFGNERTKSSIETKFYRVKK